VTLSWLPEGNVGSARGFRLRHVIDQSEEVDETVDAKSTEDFHATGWPTDDVITLHGGFTGVVKIHRNGW